MENTTTQTESLRSLQIAFNIVKRLRPISRLLRKYHEYECNYGELTPRQQKRYNKELKRAKELAKDLGFNLFLQGDPRGCALYIIDDTMNSSNYSNGLAIV